MAVSAEQQVKIRSLDQYLEFVRSCSGRVGSAARNAMSHLYMATQIAELDPLMAAFRSICAEEEAATALIASLKKHKYAGAEKINLHNHQHKQSVIVFIQLIREWYESFHPEVDHDLDRVRFYPCEVAGRKAIGIFMPIKGTSKSIYIEPPLSLRVRGDESWAGILREGIQRICVDGEFKKFSQMIKDRANFRNQLLYASDGFAPKWSGDVGDFIVNQSGIVGALLRTLGLIDPWIPSVYEKSPLVEACIEVCLEMMYQNRS